MFGISEARPNETDKEREARWKAEDDARTLAEAEVIRADEDRYAKAKDAASRLAKQAKDHSDAMQHVAEFYAKDETQKPVKREANA